VRRSPITNARSSRCNSTELAPSQVRVWRARVELRAMAAAHATEFGPPKLELYQQLGRTHNDILLSCMQLIAFEPSWLNFGPILATQNASALKI